MSASCSIKAEAVGVGSEGDGEEGEEGCEGWGSSGEKKEKGEEEAMAAGAVTSRWAVDAIGRDMAAGV